LKTRTIRAVPVTVVIGRDGRVVRTFQESVNPVQLERAVTLAAGQ
jgi:hypothetical protein